MSTNSTIMIIRHGEKPVTNGTTEYRGVNITGAADKHSLIPQGWMRCGALGRFFKPQSKLPELPIVVPDSLYACGSKKRCPGSFGPGSGYPLPFPQPPTIAPSVDHKAPKKSLREQEVLLAISDFTQISINDTYFESKETELARHVAKHIGEKNNVLIAWNHSDIWTLCRALSNELPMPSILADVPRVWPSWRFDVVYVFSSVVGEAQSLSWNFEQVPQLLLPGDLAEPIPIDAPIDKSVATPRAAAEG